MNFNLNQLTTSQEKTSTYGALRSLLKLIRHERSNLWLALAIVLANATLSLMGPFMIGYTIDRYVQHRNYAGVLRNGLIMAGMFVTALFTAYYQTRVMGGVGQRLLFTLRNTIFEKLQSLPVAFFNANKAGDLISRINNDTDKLNAFFSQSLMQFVGSIVIMTGAGLFLLFINPLLGSATLVPAVLILVFTRIASPWVKAKNTENLKSVGGLSAEIQESLNNFRVIIAFNRRDYFRQKFEVANVANYRSSVGAGLANNIFLPVFSFFASSAQLIVLVFGIYLIASGRFTVGFLVSYLAYATNFYNPLRQLASLWTSFQVAMAGWDRIGQVLTLDTNLKTIPGEPAAPLNGSDALVEFQNVHFGYVQDQDILHNISLTLERGKTYAFVGPTGGGKTTTASLIARLYDPTKGVVLFDGKDIRSYEQQERSKRIGFILQEPFLFTGTVRENILYGNEPLQGLSNEKLEKAMNDAGLAGLVRLFDSGLDSTVTSTGDGISLGQKQLIAFIRAVLRNPDVLILDEATANIDTVTEQLLDEILSKLPATTTRIIIAHRLNTIENADEIFFVNAGEVIPAGSFDHAVDMLLRGRRAS